MIRNDRIDKECDYCEEGVGKEKVQCMCGHIQCIFCLFDTFDQDFVERLKRYYLMSNPDIDFSIENKGRKRKKDPHDTRKG